GVLDLMLALERGVWDVAEASGHTERAQASGLVAAHLQWHLERQLRSLPMIERRAPHDGTPEHGPGGGVSPGPGRPGADVRGTATARQDEVRDPATTNATAGS